MWVVNSPLYSMQHMLFYLKMYPRAIAQQQWVAADYAAFSAENAYMYCITFHQQPAL